MKICVIASTAQRCGIARYTRGYVDALSRLARVWILDAEQAAQHPYTAIRANEADVVHIQYETSHFFSGNKDRYETICRQIDKPMIVTLHELYETPPHAYPRERINGLAGPLRRAWYDLRHPYQTAFRRHINRGFFADSVHVHYPYLLNTLKRLSSNITDAFVLPHPVPDLRKDEYRARRVPADDVTRLGSTGFIGLGYDFSLLVQTLDRISFPWHFTWIGGPHNADGERLLEQLRVDIAARNWEDNFRITGWVSEDDLINEMNRLDFYLAFFRSKSTSSSLCTALGAHIPILATSSALVSDIIGESGAVVAGDSNPDQLCHKLHELVRSPSAANALRRKASEYANRHRLENTAQFLYDRYRYMQSIPRGTMRT